PGGGYKLRTNYCFSEGASNARDLSLSLLSRSGWPSVLRARPDRGVSKGGIVCRPHIAWRETSRPSGPVADQVRTGDQSKDRKSDRPYDPAHFSRSGR